MADKVYLKVSDTEAKISQDIPHEDTVSIDLLLAQNKELQKRVDGLTAKINENLADIAEMKKLGLKETV